MTSLWRNLVASCSDKAFSLTITSYKSLLFSLNFTIFLRFQIFLSNSRNKYVSPPLKFHSTHFSSCCSFSFYKWNCLRFVLLSSKEVLSNLLEFKTLSSLSFQRSIWHNITTKNIVERWSFKRDLSLYRLNLWRHMGLFIPVLLSMVLTSM